MIYIILLGLSVIIFVKLSNLTLSIKVLESEVEKLKINSVSTSQNILANEIKPNLYVPSEIDQETKILKVTKVEEMNAESDFENQLSSWFKDNLILKIGVIMILAGFGWFVSYAFMHNWIGPAGRIALGTTLGSLFTIFGSLRLGKNKTQGVAFTVLGSALVIISVLAGQYFYNFFSPFTVLSIVFLVSAYVSFSAVFHSIESLAVYGLFLSLLAPYFSHTAEMDPLLMYLYLLVVSVGTIWVSIEKNWNSVTSVGITGVFLYSINTLWVNPANLVSNFALIKYILLYISYFISLVYLAVNVYSLVRNKIKVSGNDIFLTIINTSIILGFTISIVPTTYQSIVIIAWTLVYALLGFFVFQKTRNDQMFLIHTLVSILLLGIATSIEFKGHTLVIAMALEAAVISISSYVVTGKIKVAQNFSFLLIVPLFISLPSFISSKWDSGVMHSDFAVLLVMAFILGVLGFFFKLNKEESPSDDLKVSHMLFIISTFYVYSLIWLSSHSLFQNNDMAVFFSLLVFTIVGLVTHFVGLFQHNVILKNYGMTLLVLVVIRLVLVDVWNMELTLRIVTFIVLGVMFISTAFISKNQSKEVIS